MIRIKKMVCVCSVFYIVLPHLFPALGAFEYMGLGWSAAMANIKVVGLHPSQFVLNPALMKRTETSRFALSYQYPFQSLDLQAGSLTFLSRYKEKTYIHHLDYFGDDIYTELSVINGAAWTIQDGFRLGITLNYQSLAMSDFRRRQAMTLSLSSHAYLTDQFQVGSVLEHMVQWENGLTIPQKFHIGAQYTVGMTNLLLALEKESALPLELCLGLVLSPGSFLQIALGYRDVSGMISTGWRIHTKRIALHYVCVIHPQLPISKGFGLEFILP